MQKKYYPPKKKESKQDWTSDEILEKMRQRKKAKFKDPALYSQLNREIDAECAKAKEDFWNNKCEELEKHHRSREMQRRVKDITGESHKRKREQLHSRQERKATV